jgi:hypothetical protein
LGIGDWAQSPIPNPQSPIPNPQSPDMSEILQINIIIKYYIIKNNKNESQTKFTNSNNN